MTPYQKYKIVKTAKEFVAPFEDTVGSLNGSGWLIVDPLSGYLNACGWRHKVSQLEPTEAHPQVLVLEFSDGSRLIPAGGDLKPLSPAFHNWIWI